MSGHSRTSSDVNRGTFVNGPPFRSSVGKMSQSSGGGAGSAEPGGALEEALKQLGPFGFYQRYVLILICVPNMLAAMYSLNYVFVADQVPFR